jgi:hypothetical protein
MFGLHAIISLACGLIATMAGHSVSHSDGRGAGVMRTSGMGKNADIMH